MIQMMPPFFAHLISIYVLIILQEQERTRKRLEEIGEEHNMTNLHFAKDAVNVIAFVLNIYNFIVWCRQSYNLRTQ